MANPYTKSLIADFALIYHPKVSKKMQIKKYMDDFLPIDH